VVAAVIGGAGVDRNDWYLAAGAALAAVPLPEEIAPRLRQNYESTASAQMSVDLRAPRSARLDAHRMINNT